MLATGHVHVWVLEIMSNAPFTERAYTVLSDAERTAAARFVRVADSTRYVHAHGTLRHLLASCTGRHPRELQFEASPEGKPCLADSDVQFSLSHSGNYIAVGVCVGRPVGVDIEEMRADRYFRQLARAYFAPDEVEWLESAPTQERPTRFFRLWVVKEALLKATGKGVSGLEEAVVGNLHPPVRLHSLGHEWCVEEFDGIAGYSCAAAARSGTPIEWHSSTTEQTLLASLESTS